jgi:Na+-transporting NADH:ubiquinone oxidoreductase subunit C
LFHFSQLSLPLALARIAVLHYKITLQKLKSLIFILTASALFTSCLEPTLTIKPIPEDQLDQRKIGVFIDSTFTNSSDLAELVHFKKLNVNGKVEDISLKESMKLYKRMRKSGTDAEVSQFLDTRLEFPFYELKNSDKVVFITKGKGLWGAIWVKIMVDRTSNTILKVAFNHKTETPGLGAEIIFPPFQNQFRQQPITFNGATFGLLQNNSILIEGEKMIDGIAGATISSTGAVESVNQVQKFEDYLH